MERKGALALAWSGLAFPGPGLGHHPKAMKLHKRFPKKMEKKKKKKKTRTALADYQKDPATSTSTSI
jgi:hypothetical protein